ncbi:hypothetical protein ACFP8W_24620, partial [Nocardioides hankookensis]
LEAASHLRVALDRAADPMLRASIELELARVLRDTADIEGCIRHAESAKQAFEAAGDELSTAAAVAQLAYGIGTGRHDYETSIAMAEERYDALRGRLDAVPVLLELLKVLTGLKLRTSSSLGDVAEERARLAEVVGSPDEVADSYNGLALHHMLTGTRGIGRIIFEAAAEISRRHHLPAALTRSLVNLNVSWTPDDASRAVEFGREALVVGRQSGSVYAHSSAGSNLALAALVSGEWDEALSAADEAVMDVPLA